MNDDAASPPPTPAPPPVTAPSASPIAWLREGLRALLFREPVWDRVRVQPATILGMLATSYLLAVVLQRIVYGDAAIFYWTGILSGWAGLAVVLLACWITGRSTRDREEPGPATDVLFTIVLAMDLCIGLAQGALHLALLGAIGPSEKWHPAVLWAAWVVPVGWVTLAIIRLLSRAAGSVDARVASVVLLPLTVATMMFQPVIFWWVPPAKDTVKADSEGEPGSEAEPYGLSMTEDVLDTQTQLLDQALRALPPSQPGRVNVYAATYAPYMSEDVFMHESEVVAKTMAERFGAGERTVQLVANRKTQTTLPWAIRPNLRRTIERMAAVMNREQDVLFLHLTSHGGKDGRLAADTFPLESEPLTPELLKQWLDDAGVRWRVISVSACYSGSWIAPLADDGTLVMTAADADHTSYGCGSRSPLTFFGQAMYVDALKDTWSFTQAHAQARKLIDTREKAAGKSDGYSNPQIREGAAIAPVLRRLEAQQAGR